MKVEVTAAGFDIGVSVRDVMDVNWRDRRNQPGQRPDDIEVLVYTEHQFQTMEGIGGAFSEMGWNALASLPEKAMKKVMQDLFGPPPGSAFSFCRVPVGSSDFATSAYSLDDHPGDYGMAKFSVERDEHGLIPFIKAAQTENPGLNLHASPWSPPGWLKTSGRMDGGDGSLIDDPKVSQAYALYLRRFVEEYARRGIPIHRLFVQNEPDAKSKFPSCFMPPEQMMKFTVDALAPEFRRAGLGTEIWAGTFRGITGLQSHRCMAHPRYRETVGGVGFQYAFPEDIRELQFLYPGTKVMHTESVCYKGENSVTQAVALVHDFFDHLKAGCTAYTYWNMVLDETSTSAWGWKQNSLVRIDRQTGEVNYNPDFHVMSLFGRHIAPGACRIESFCFVTRALAFQNPDGRVVVFLYNPDDARDAVFELNGKRSRHQVPARSLVAVTMKL